VSARKDADRIAALVVLIEELEARKSQTLGDVAGEVFGWDGERVFRAIRAAIDRKLIAPAMPPPKAKARS
jgi:hypothetical protein